jgi:hypothetical protein
LMQQEQLLGTGCLYFYRYRDQFYWYQFK